MALSIVIPVFNEESTIQNLVNAVRAVPIDKEIVIVDDGSTDGTPAALHILERECDNVQVIRHAENLGKGAALRTGFSQAKQDIVIVQDGDLEYDPREYQRLIQPILDGKADVVYGSRFIGGQSRRVLYFWHSMGNRLLTLLSNVFTNLNLSDMETCYKVFKRDIIQQVELYENGFGFEPEVTAKITRIPNVRIYEVGISYAGRTYQDGKKIGWRDGVHAVWCILKYGLFSSS
jgi:glycosyltransferase involved in cell wall biosynthesis